MASGITPGAQQAGATATATVVATATTTATATAATTAVADLTEAHWATLDEAAG